MRIKLLIVAILLLLVLLIACEHCTWEALCCKVRTVAGRDFYTCYWQRGEGDEPMCPEGWAMRKSVVICNGEER